MRKAITNKDHRFIWSPQTPISGTPQVSIDTISNITADLVRFAADITVTAIANDRRTLTIVAAPASYYREMTSGFLITSADTYYAVNVSRIVSTTAILAEPLPREIDFSSTATLQLATSYADISAANLANSGVYPYRVNFDQLDMSTGRQERGLFKITPRPFNTGLDHYELVETFAQLADMVPRRQSDYEPQIKAAHHEIVLSIRDHLNSDDITEDDVFNPESFMLAHKYCTAAIIYEMNLNLDAAEAMRNRCHELMNSALRSISLDLDGDGVIDGGEENLRRVGGSSRDFRASWRTYSKSANDRFFTPERGMKH
tara:strand:- start:265 stop:1209 length:945 start_codon:yes stop_codon:yes gene_type:complete